MLTKEAIQNHKTANEKADFTGLHPENQADAYYEAQFEIELCDRALQALYTRAKPQPTQEGMPPEPEKYIFTKSGMFPDTDAPKYAQYDRYIDASDYALLKSYIQRQGKEKL